MKITFRRVKPISADVNMTPLIDMVFLLILFFMVTYNYSNELTALNVNLPAVGKKGRIPVANLDVRISRAEEIFVGEQRISTEELKKILAERKMSAEKVSLTVYADRAVSHGTVVKVLDVAANAGVDSLSVAALTERSAAL